MMHALRHFMEFSNDFYQFSSLFCPHNPFFKECKGDFFLYSICDNIAERGGHKRELYVDQHVSYGFWGNVILYVFIYRITIMYNNSFILSFFQYIYVIQFQKRSPKKTESCTMLWMKSWCRAWNENDNFWFQEIQ